MEMNVDDVTIHQVEDIMHIKIYPGTEIMADIGNIHFVKSNTASDRVLVPQPSSDVNDPLNWTKTWKYLTMFLATMVTFSQSMGPLAIAPQFPALMSQFDCSLEDAIAFSGVAILVLGFSNFFWVPIQTAFGRRPVMIFSTLMCTAASIWKAKAQTYGSFMGASALHGFGAGPGESIQPTIVADIMFLHERGAYNTLYFFTYFGGVTIGPVIAGPMTQHINWRSFWWFNVVYNALIFVAVLCCFPETRWGRRSVDEVLRRESITNERLDTNGMLDTNVEESKVSEQPTSITSATPSQVEQEETRDPNLGKGSPSKGQFKLLHSHGRPLQSMLTEFVVPWKLFAFPIVEFAAFAVSWSASVFLTLNLTQSQIFSAPPYNLGPQTVGLFNLATFVGAGIGLLTNGPLSDWVSMRATRKAGGFREPEMRLPTLVPYVIIMIIANFVVAFGYQQKWSWKIIVIIGYTLGGLQVAAIPSIIATYAVDSYKPVAGSIFVAITVNKNVWGYGFSKFINSWIATDGALPPIMLNMSLTVLFCALAIPFYYWGKTCRKWTRNSKVHDMDM